MTENRGPDGLTPRERLEAAGYEFDEKGRTVELGYDGARNAVDADFQPDPWHWLEQRVPDLTLRCHPSRVVIAHVWSVPDGSLWFRSSVALADTEPLESVRSVVYQGPTTAWLTEGGHLPVVCAVHGIGLVPPAWLADNVAARREFVSVRCDDPSPVYRRP